MQDFKLLIEHNLVYVDKTDLLFEIVNRETAFIINGERRTGKTLLLSAIRTIFGEEKRWWEDHGKNLKIWQLDLKFFDENPHPVIHFDFSQSESNAWFLDRIKFTLKKTIRMYELPLNDIKSNTSLRDLIDKFGDVLIELCVKFKKPAVITIDESDQPLLIQMFDERIKDENLRNARMSEAIISFNRFYGFLKAMLASNNVRLVVVAGHSMIAKSTIYSGNILFFLYVIMNFLI